MGAAPLGFCWCWTGNCKTWVAAADLSPGSSVAVPWRCTEQSPEVLHPLHQGPAVTSPSKTFKDERYLLSPPKKLNFSMKENTSLESLSFSS